MKKSRNRLAAREVRHPLGGKDWGSYTIMVESELLDKFRRAVRAQGEVQSRVLTRSLAAYVREWEKKKARRKSESES